MAFTDTFIMTEALKADLEKYGYMEDVLPVSEEEIAANPELDLPYDYSEGDPLYRLKPEVAEELARSEEVFMSYEHAEEMLRNAKEVTKSFVEEFARAKFPGLKDLEVTVRDRIQDRYVGQDAGALYVDISSPMGEIEIEPAALYYSGASEALPNSFSSWNWAFWLGSYTSPFRSEPFTEGYEYNEICSALEQFAQTITETDFPFDLEKELSKLQALETEVESKYPTISKLL